MLLFPINVLLLAYSNLIARSSSRPWIQVDIKTSYSACYGLGTALRMSHL